MIKKKILFVDDDLDSIEKDPSSALSKMRKMVTKFGDVFDACSLTSAKDRLREEKIDLAIVDLYIPFDDTGIKTSDQFSKQLFDILYLEGIPIIGISNKRDIIDFGYISELKDKYGISVITKVVLKVESLEEKTKELLSPKKRSRRCAFKDNKVCTKNFSFKGQKSVFIISSDEYKRTAKEFGQKLKERNYFIDIWNENERISAELIFCNKTCLRIYGNKIIVAEITDFNHNVFFEIGFAFGLGRIVFMFRRKQIDGHLELKLLGTISWTPYKVITDILEKFDKTIKDSERELLSDEVYSAQQPFDYIDNFESPEKRKKGNFKFIVSYKKSLIDKIKKFLKEEGLDDKLFRYMNLSDKRDFIAVVRELINAKAVLFLPQDQLDEVYGQFRVNNAEIMLLAGLCVAQEVPAKIITESRPADSNRITLSINDNEDIARFMAQ